MENNYEQPNEEEQMQKKSGGKTFLKVICVLLVLALIGTGVYFGVTYFSKNLSDSHNTVAQVETTRVSEESTTVATQSESASTVTTQAETTKVSNAATGGAVAYDVSQVVEDVMPCVVAITDNLEITQSSSFNPYSYYFGNGGNSNQTQESAASGSGVIIDQNDTELLIVTNNHVVDNSGSTTTYTVESKGLSVAFSDGTTADAYVKGTDSNMDLAVIAVSLDNISADTMNSVRLASLGNSDDAKVGSGVIAIGNALGYGQSVTSGILSAKDREVTIDDITRSLMQTDAAINPGNSGGGLFNLNGELIGINSAKYSDTTVEGIGYAIPISAAESIIDELKNKEVIATEDQGYLGINGETVPDNYVSSYGYPKGVSVTRIAENSPADKSGLKLYDIITAVNGSNVSTMAQLKEEVNSYAAGTTITLTISRAEGRSFKETKVDVTLVRYSDLSDVSSSEASQEPYTEESDIVDETSSAARSENRFGN